jgi:hypothetical protein
LWSTGGSWGGLPDYIKLWTPRLDALKAAGNRPDWVPDRGNNNADRSWDYASAHHTPRGGFDLTQHPKTLTNRVEVWWTDLTWSPQ